MQVERGCCLCLLTRNLPIRTRARLCCLMKESGWFSWTPCTSFSSPSVPVSSLFGWEGERQSLVQLRSRSSERIMIKFFCSALGCRKSLSCRAIAPDVVVDLLCPSIKKKGFRLWLGSITVGGDSSDELICTLNRCSCILQSCESGLLKGDLQAVWVQNPAKSGSEWKST